METQTEIQVMLTSFSLSKKLLLFFHLERFILNFFNLQTALMTQPARWSTSPPPTWGWSPEEDQEGEGGGVQQE